jgi:hypothetical protein
MHREGIVWDRGRCLHALSRLVLACVLVACGMRAPQEMPTLAAPAARIAMPTEDLTPTALPVVTQTPTVFRSEQYHLTVALPPGWASAEGPQLLAKPYEGLVAFNNWGEPGFWAAQVETQTTEGMSYRYDRASVLSQIPDGGAYVVLIQIEGPGGVWAEAYGPEYGQQDLGGLPLRSGSEFFKWGRCLRLEVYRRPNASPETAVELDALLASWRFDRVPVGDPGWAILEARRLLPPEIHPLAFPLRDGRRVWQGDVVRSTQTEVVGDTVLVTFTYRWDVSTTGELPDDCLPGRCRWWRLEARPSGEVVLVEEGGAELPMPTPTPHLPFP